MSRRFVLLVSLMSPLLMCCGRQAEVDDSLSAYVNDILKDRDAAEYVSLSSCSSLPLDAAIWLAGDSESCNILSGKLLGCDSYDNVSGWKASDGLPDFSGETIAVLKDYAAVPYFKYLDEHGKSGLSELFTRHLLNSLDTICSLTCYDIDCKGHKPLAKTLVFTDPLFVRYARRDVDALLTGTSCALPVLSPIELAYDELLKDGKTVYNVGILCDSLHAGFSAYSEILKEKAGKDISVTCFSSYPKSHSDVLKPFLNAYRDAGGREVLDALVVDNVDVDLARLQADLLKIRDLNRPDCVTFGKLVSPDFRVIDSSALVADKCFSLFRQLNLFTHRISYPVGLSFGTFASPERGSHCFLIVPEDNV